ncbi:MAG: hypothetical protein QM736_05020 [Vicinamibacterales bacterium]
MLSRAAFGQGTTPRDVWRARRMVWWRHLWLSLTIRRLSPWRTVTEPVYFLEGLGVNDRASARGADSAAAGRRGCHADAHLQRR